METKDYLSYIVHEIHRTVVATVDDDGLPVTAAIDMMACEDDSLFFLTAKGKPFYDRLMKRKVLALTALKGEDTMSSVAVSLRGNVRCIGSERLADLFEQNPYMYEIYPTEASRESLAVFQIYEGTGEWFDLSKKPIERAQFSFGGAPKLKGGYYVTKKCNGCGLCAFKCPQDCINIASVPVVIRQENCLHCGNCAKACPGKAVRWMEA